MRSFQFRSILYIERCAYIFLEHLSNAFSNFKYLAARHGMFEPTKNLYFLVTCPRLDPNDGIIARGFAWMSLEETVVVYKSMTSYSRLLVVYILM